MKVLVTGGNVANKGAHLMLIAFATQIKIKYPKVELFLSPTIEMDASLKDLGYKPLGSPIFLFVSSAKLFWMSLYLPIVTIWMLKFLYNQDYKLGDCKLKDVDYVFDVSGFSFGDKWGVGTLNNLRRFSNYCRHRKIPLILMPQAFGPFTSASIQSAGRLAFSKIPLLFVRDKSSFQELQNITNNNENIIQALDITLNLHPNFNKSIRPIEGDYVCVVPNARMLDKADHTWQANYESYLKRAINLVLDRSQFSVVILAHCQKSSEDYRLCVKLADIFNEDQRVVLTHNENPLILKTILSKAQFLIGSRFHALASALSSNVPCVGTSWNHKYEQLFEEYGVLSYSHNRASNYFLDSVVDLLDDENSQKLSLILKNRNAKIFEKNDEMWSIIEDLIKE